MELINEIITFLPQVLEGLKVTIKIFAITLILSIPLGVIVALGRVSKVKLIKSLTGI